MTRRLALALATLCASATVALGPVAAAPAQAAPDCPVVTVQDSTKAARAVFAGTVTAVEKQPRTDGQPGAIYQQSVEVARVYQGRISTETVDVQTDRNLQQCSLGALDVGTAYMFFVTADGDTWLASGTSGTRANSEAVTSQVERLLGTGKLPVAPQPESAEFEAVDTDDPTPLTRAAAPGGALVLVGLLGLAVVQGLRRRR
ncbi:hypothetical protein [Nocardioides flavescens]|uniref:Tissue inhibitor of metalloproteinase n=1 Tax=Nocardioides flavescens TaxID=2691959 RepID=A0A6L7EQS2_9ACTN|nr:hypothetical protein [Nocardioides flavescens]MXG88980.1 hypothetical protein [Nocardioides flavescens]